jgi:hypothetical protein
MGWLGAGSQSKWRCYANHADSAPFRPARPPRGQHAWATPQLHSALHRQPSGGPAWHRIQGEVLQYLEPSGDDDFVQLLIGDSAKAAKQLGWVPKVKFKELVKIMVEADLELAEQDKKMKSLG